MPGPRDPRATRPTRDDGRAASVGPTVWEPETLDLLRRFSQSATSTEALAIADLAATPPPSVLMRCLSQLKFQYLEKRGLRGVLSVAEDLPALDAAEGPLRSLLEHLVEGSLRGNQADAPYCHVGVSAEDDQGVTLYLRDNGESIPECTFDEIREFIRTAKVEKVPDRIYRLFLADNLVQWVGGRMWVGPSANGQGTTVFLRLPKNASAARPSNGLVARHVF